MSFSALRIAFFLLSLTLPAKAALVHQFDASDASNTLSGNSLIQWTDSGPGRNYGSGLVNIHLNRASGITLTPNFSSPGTLLSASFSSAGANTSGSKSENQPQSSSIGNGLTDATFEFWVRADLEDTERPNWQVVWESGATTNGFAVLLSTNGVFDAELRVIKAWTDTKIVDITIPLPNFESSDFFQIAVIFDGDSTVDNNDAIRVYARDAVGNTAYGEDLTGEYSTLAGSDDCAAFTAVNQTTFGNFGACGGNSGNTISMSGFAGEISLIRVYDSILNAAEIETNYDAIADVGDNDNDGMLNFWEEVNGFNKNDPNDALLDADNDGLNNLGEHDRRTDPNNRDTDGDGVVDGYEVSLASNPLSIDSDGDRIPDGDEIAMNPYITSPIRSDTDNDGISDPVEIMVGSDPTLQASVPQSILITEFMASNGFTLDDEDSEASDWIEILNPTAAAVTIGGMFLTDDASTPQKWQFPAGLVIQPGEFLIVFASGKDRAVAGQILHTNFNLNSSGEYLALIDSDGSSVITEFAPAFPEQQSDISYGFNGLYLTEPSPGGVNFGPSVSGFVGDTAFSVDRGFYTAPISVDITTPTLGATIIYTTDSSTPSLTNGTQVTSGTASINISDTTVLRAAAFKDGLAPTNVDTHTYLFLDDVVTQSDNPNDYEYTNWDNLDQARGADYGMDTTDIVGNLHTLQEVKDSLASLPTISMSTDAAKLFDRTTGNYANSKKGGQEWEREVSLEFFGFPHGQDAQINGGLRLAGNASRSPDRRKHNMRVAFRREYGAGVLEYPLFPDTGVTTFNSIQLRGGNGDAWINAGVRDRATYVRDQWHRDVLKAMEQPTQSQIYAHLYINGWYWGVFHIFERIEDNFLAEHYGGNPEDWDVRDHVSAFDGTNDSWNAAMAIADHPATLANPQKFAELQDYIDLEHTIDYLLLHYYSNSDDWDQNNLRSAYNFVTGDPYRFFAWDQERTLLNSLSTPNVNAATALDKNTNTSTKKGPTHLHQQLRVNPEYRLLFADRVRRHCFHGGPLSPGGAAALWDHLAAEVRPAMICESARWGDLHGPAKTVAQWESRIDLEKSGWFDIRTPILLNLLNARSLYPNTVAPDFGVNGSAMHGGNVSSGDALSMTAPSGTIVYTLDGSDPREAVTSNIAGTVYSGNIPLSSSVTVKARALDNGEWSALTEAPFIVGTPAAEGNIVISEIMYHPAGNPDAEYLELMNISATESIDLTGCGFSNGIDFAFADFTSIAPGERHLIVRDLSIFESVYGSGLPVAGLFQNLTGLNDDGEQLTLLDKSGASIQDFTYNDKDTWPRGADGDGFSLVLIQPETDPDHADPANWRPSVDPNGAPNTSDTTSFAEWAALNGVTDPLEDTDGNGRPAIIDYAVGKTSPLIDGDILSIEVDRLPGHDDAQITAEVSIDLLNWTTIALYRSDRTSGSLTEKLTFQSETPQSTASHQFIRIRATFP